MGKLSVDRECSVWDNAYVLLPNHRESSSTAYNRRAAAFGQFHHEARDIFA
jgi:hypothetical protein